MPENGQTIIAVRDVAFGYTCKKTVLEHVSFGVPQGQSLAILGYNGVGKTTLFNIIVGLLRPRSGEAVINANLVPSMQDVFQLSDESNLAATMTVRENIRFRAMLMDTGRRNGRQAIDLEHLENEKLVQAFGLTEHLDKKVKELSSGLRKRAGLVAGMLFEPHVILLDEPTNSVDPITRDLMIDLMEQLNDSGRTILTITHDLEYCWSVADRVVILDDRHIAKDMMLDDFQDFDAFKQAATLGRTADESVDFGIR